MRIWLSWEHKDSQINENKKTVYTDRSGKGSYTNMAGPDGYWIGP